MFIIQDIYRMNRDVLKKTLQSLKTCPGLFMISFVIYIVNYFVLSIAGIFGFLAGIFLMLANSLLLAVVLYALEQVIRYKRLRQSDLQNGAKLYFRRALIAIIIVEISVAIVFYAGNILGSIGTILFIGALLAGFVAFNPVPEMLYLRHFTEGDTFKKSLEFMKENWLEWLVPVIPMSLILFAAGMIGSFSTPLIGSLGGIVIRILFTPFFMVYRGHLYEFLSRSNRRKRLFKRHLH